MDGDMILHSDPSNDSLSNATVRTVLLTPFELWLRISIGLGLGTVSVLLHSLIAISLCKGNGLENRFHVFLFFLSISRIMYGFGHFCVATYRVLRTAGLAPTAMSSFACHSIQMFGVFPPTLELVILFMLIFDRAIAFGYPLIYRNFSTSQAKKLCAGACLIWFLFRFLPSYFGVSATDVIQCVNTLSPLAPSYAICWQYLDFVFSLSILVPFAYLVIAVWRRMHHENEQATADASFRRLVKVLPFLRLQLIMHCALVITSRSMQLAAAYVKNEADQQRMIAYYGMMAALDVFVNAIILFWKHPKIWAESVQLLCGKTITSKLANFKVLRLTTTNAPEVTVAAATTKVGAFSRAKAGSLPEPG